MKIAEAKSKTSKRWRTHTITWEEFLDRIREPYRTAETLREYKAMGKADRDKAKEAKGGFVGGALDGGQRKTEAVRERWLITLDADSAAPGQWENVTALYDFSMAVYSTHSHTPEAPRLRWIIPTDRAMTPDEYPAVARKVASWVGIETMDPTTYEVARLMYWPTCPEDGEYVFRHQDGPVLRVDEVLAEYGDGEAWRDASLWPASRKENEVRIRAIKKAGDPLEKNGIVGLFCRTYDVEDAIAEFLPEVYTPCSTEGRYTYAGGSTFGGAIVYDEGRFLYSNHATDPCGGMSVNAFDLVRIHRFGAMDADAGEGVPVTRLPSYRAMAEWAVTLPEVKDAAAEENIARLDAEFGDLLENREEEEPKAWRSQLTLDDKTGGIEESIHNACLLLRNMPEFKGKLGYNPMKDVITVKGDLPWWTSRNKMKLGDVFAGEKTALPEVTVPWGENDWPNYYAYFEKLGFPTRGKTNGILDNALQIVSQENTYHPIRSYLLDLEWDGSERLDTMFIRWLGAEDDRLNREITRLWMIAGVDRIMRPGCQFDNIIITCGPQGIGKTRMLKRLSRGFFTNSIDKLSNCKETGEKLQGVWIVELGELDGLRKSEMTSAKNFITTTTDQYRGAYTRTAADHPRQCILAGTTNEGSFLRDSTGERRFWVMPVKGTGDHGEMVGLKDEVDQLWAEAFHYWKERMEEYRAPGQAYEDVELMLYLKDPELDRQMKLRQAQYKLPEEDRDAVEGYLDELRPANWYDLDPSIRRDFAQDIWIGDKATCTKRIDRITVKELRCELFGERVEDAGTRSSRSLRLVSIMDTMPGWRKDIKKRIPGYGNALVQSWVRQGSEADKNTSKKPPNRA